MPENISDIERKAVVRLSSGDKDAFSELYLKYRKSVVYYAIRFVKSKEVAEDISQDTFAAIWNTREFLNPNISFSSYLFAIAHNRILNLLRNIASEQKLHEYISSQAVDFSDHILDDLTSKEMNEIIDQSLGKLSKIQREAFILSREDKMTHSQIALKLGITERNVNAYISLALKSIRKNLEKHYNKSTSFFIALLLLGWLK